MTQITGLDTSLLIEDLTGDYPEPWQSIFEDYLPRFVGPVAWVDTFIRYSLSFNRIGKREPYFLGQVSAPRSIKRTSKYLPKTFIPRAAISKESYQMGRSDSRKVQLIIPFSLLSK